jgi:intein/homing endonuclease
LEFSLSFQLRLLLLFYTDKEFYYLSRELIKVEFFNSLFCQWLFKYLEIYVELYKSLPTKVVIEQELLGNKDFIELPEEAGLVQEFIGLLNQHDRAELAYIKDTFLKFAKSRSIRQVLNEQSEYIDQGNFDELFSGLKEESRKFEALDAPVRDVNLFSVRNLRELYENKGGIKTGLPLIDNTIGGLGQKELSVVLADTNVGKCAAKNTEIVLSSGEIKHIQDVIVGDSVLSLNEETGKIVHSPVVVNQFQGIKDVFKVVFRSGKSIDVTDNHPFLTFNGWKKLLELQKGSIVAIPNKLPVEGDNSIPNEELELLAFMVAEGHCTGRGPHSFTNEEPEIVNSFVKSLKIYGKKHGNPNICVRQSITNKVTYKIVLDELNPHFKGVKKCDLVNCFKPFLEKYELYGKLSIHKYLPPVVFTCNNKMIQQLIGRLWSCDGYVSNLDKNTYHLQYCSGSELLVRQVSHLLLRLGIVSTIRKKKIKGEYYYSVYVRGKTDVLLFSEKIGEFLLGRKRQRLRSMCELLAVIKCKPNLDSLPKELYPIIRKKILDTGLPKEEFFRKHSLWIKSNGIYNRGISRDIVRKLAVIFNDSELSRFAESDIYWDEIAEIIPMGATETYDLQVDPHHNFIANDIIIHNSLYLVHIGGHAVRQLKRVIHVTLEMSFARTLARYYANLGEDDDDITYQQIVECDPADKVVDYIHDKLCERYEGYLQVEEFPTGKCGIPDLYNLLDKYSDTDMLIVDYLQIMKAMKRRTELRFELTDNTVALRGIASEANLHVASAAQATRQANNKRIVGKGMVGEDYGIMRVADIGVGLGQNEQDSLKQELVMSIARSRNSAKDTRERYFTDFRRMRLMFRRQEGDSH